MRGALAGRVCVVTGANRGIGFELARRLAAMGGSVAVLCRTEASAREACDRVAEATGNPNVVPFAADLAVQAEVRAAASGIAARYPSIHLLVNNAAMVTLWRGLTPDGIEQTFAVNHLAPFLLTNLLLDNVLAAGRARIVTVASGAHHRGRIDFADLQCDRGYWG